LRLLVLMRALSAIACMAGLLAGTAAAQQPPPASPKSWTTTASLGASLTSGNKDSSTFNAGYDVRYGPQTRNLVKSDALLIRGRTEGELSADRLTINARDEFRFHEGLFVFGQNRYLRDRFKEIDYLVAPTGGLGYKLRDTEATKLSIDAGVGGVWEKNTGEGVQASGAVTLGQQLTQALTETATITQSISALWKTENLDDALYAVGAGISLSVSAHTQIKLEWLDTYKNRPPMPGIQKNDMSVLVALVFKN
jgi:putative salt-induced outer membrane protein YdiY